MDKDMSKVMEASKEKVMVDKVIRSRCQMLMMFPFFGILSLKLKLEIDYTISTAATNGETLYINPNFIEELSEPEINWLIIHEVMHPALQHLWRRGDRNHDLWNQACDYAIHDVLTQFKNELPGDKGNLLKMPTHGLYNKDFTDKTADQIYDIIRKKEKKNKDKKAGGGYDNGQKTLDDHSKWNNQQTQQDGDEKMTKWQGDLIAAAQAAQTKQAGAIPGFLKRMINEIVKPQKDWRSLLSEFVQPEINDYSFNPPDKRLSEVVFSIDEYGMPIEVLLPDFNDEVDCVKDILFMVDTSGSVGTKELSASYSEITGAISQFENKLTGKLGFFDYEVYEPIDFESIEDVLEIKPKGGGGTSFHVIFDYINKTYKDLDEIAGIVILTDGYAPWPNESMANGIPVLWLINNEVQVPPWGRHATIKID